MRLGAILVVSYPVNLRRPEQNKTKQQQLSRKVSEIKEADKYDNNNNDTTQERAINWM
jgi:hypothetical protein